LTKLWDVSIIELSDEADSNVGEAERLALLEREGMRIQSCFNPSDISVALDVRGKLAKEPFFYELIDKVAFELRPLVFIIGGSLGISDSVLRQTKYKVSLSELTYTHRLARLLLLEILCGVAETSKN
jgi:23S rRNA (pseudouridine1915-N3)-methyltransferase